MDIHRCRFVPYPASPINALAFSHDSNVSHAAPRSLRLAVGRANGDIEIWNPEGGCWVQEQIFRGRDDRSIEGLAWTQDPVYEDEEGQRKGGQLRLFSIGYSTVVTEWDISTGRPARHSSGNYDEIWCMAAQPRHMVTKPEKSADEEEKHYQKLVVGCADGALVLHSTTSDDLRYLRTLPRPSKRRARVLSVTWQTVDRIVAGYSDNAIRIVDSRGHGRIVHSMSIGGSKRGLQEVLVWTVKCLQDGTIVSGDSSGSVKIWDGKTLSLMQQLNSHNADVLTLNVSLDGTTMVSGGIDRRTVAYHRIASGKDKGRWAQVSHRRLHASDVKTMTAFEAKDTSVVVSGGLDAELILLPRRGFGMEHPRRLAVHPNLPPLQSSPSHRLIMSYWGTEVRIWRVERYDAYAAENSLHDAGVLSHKLVTKIELQGKDAIESAAFAEDSSLLAVSTASATKVFKLRQSRANILQVEKVKAPAALSGKGSRLLAFSPDLKWLLQVELDSTPALFRICWNQSHDEFVFEPRPIRLERKERKQHKFKPRDGTHGQYDRTIQRTAWSSNSRILVACDLRGVFDSWVLEGDEDLMRGDDNVRHTAKDSMEDGSDDDSSDEDENPIVFGQRWVRINTDLPKLGSAPLVLSFRPDASVQLNGQKALTQQAGYNSTTDSLDDTTDGDRLIAISSLNQIFEYHVMSGSFTAWSRRNPPEMLPQEFQNIRERAMGCVWDVRASSARLWLYGSSWLWMFDLGYDLQSGELSNGVGDVATWQSKKRKREATAQETRQLMQNTSGAGSRIPYADQDTGMMPAVLQTDGTESKWTSLEPDHRTEPVENGPVSPRPVGELILHRRQSLATRPAVVNGHTNGGSPDVGADHEDHTEQPAPSRQWWTFKYRPILGIVPLGMSEAAATANGDTVNTMEIALVERPLWDVELPPRWEGNQEWKK